LAAGYSLYQITTSGYEHFGGPFRFLTIWALLMSFYAGSELIVQRFSQSSPGTVTSGLPYPFLNSMEWAERSGFYGLNIGVALGLVVVFGIVGFVLRHKVHYT
jgi:hypothetical protein